MSCSRGNASRTRAQKHKNRHVFKNDLHDKTPTQQKINALHVCEVCERCKLQIEWKIKYKKYKPLTQAKTCIKCNNRTVKKAYHVICRDCAVKERSCAKCLKSASEVNIEPPSPTEQEQIQLKVEMDRLIAALPERKRRTFLRYMKKGKEDEAAPPVEENDEGDGDEPKLRAPRVPHSRNELLQKIDLLKLAETNDSDLDSDLGSEFDSEDEEDDDDCDDELK